ncbi:hypothetical protein GGR92_004502 [Spirosoma lacussanchae]|uniref:YbhB/YbcL family Raf kinase inhibitor-like protein n=1 Tax=Spirosoma lacussanchae TaxID=1884249 RepID=UPI0011099E0E|nr:YbhB/YbcL family Raf kinase inhibitor-like protein [Spirosoma lacussanchae]
MRLLQRILLGVFVVLGLLAVGLHLYARSKRTQETDYHLTLRKTLTVTSSSFPPGGDMPVNCTCKGQEVSPALNWDGDIPGVESYVILTTDYDVPTPAFPLFNLSHWVVYNLPDVVHSLPEGVSAEQMRMLGGKTGKNGAGALAFIGPCPPVGRHAYVFRVYALDQALTFEETPDKQSVLNAMQGHVLAYGELTGYFQ